MIRVLILDDNWSRSRGASATTGGLPGWAVALWLALLMLGLVLPTGVAQAVVETPRTIRVVMDNAYAPYSFLSDDGKLQGILIDLLNKMGIESEFRHSTPIFRDGLRRAVRKGNTALLRKVSDGFGAIEPSDLKQIDEKWFGRTINRIG